MERRTFMNNAAGAATALAFKPMALAGEHDKIPVSPIRRWKWVSLGRKIQSRQRGGRAVIYRKTVGRRAVCLFSDIPHNRMLRWLEDTGEVSVFPSASNYSNGNFRDRRGKLLTRLVSKRE
jgi:hypothetical protein